MLLHLIMFTVFMSSIIGKTIAVTGYLDTKDVKDYKKSLAWYTANIWLQFLDEVILCLLFVNFSAPKNAILNLDQDGSVSVSVSEVSISNFHFYGTTYKD